MDEIADGGTGEILSVSLLDGVEKIGSGYYSIPEIQVSGTGEGAVIRAKIIPGSVDPGIVGFEVLEGGSGYSEESLSFKVVPTIQNIA